MGSQNYSSRYSWLLLSFIWIGLSIGGDTQSHLFPPGAMGLNQVSEFNVTGPLNSFMEQIQANSRSQPQSQEFPQIQPISQQNQQQQQHQQVPIIQIPPTTNVYTQGQIPQFPNLQQPQPVIIGPQNRPSIDPALQQLLNSFNAVPAEAQRNTFLQTGPVAGEANIPVISYITCYVGCSHVTNIVTNSAIKTVNINPTVSIVFLMISISILIF